MYINREIESQIISFNKRKEVTAIIGARQTGKTTLLKFLAAQLRKQGENVKYITFEKISDLELFDSVEDFKDLHKNYQVVIIDEFQYAKEGGKKLKYLYDTTNIKFIISGSSSLDIIYNTGKYMVGRMINFMLYPFSFREFLSYKNKDLYNALITRIPNVLASKFNIKDAFDSAINDRIEKLFEEYLIYGGYPEVVLSERKEIKLKILENILSNYLLKDISSLLQLATDQQLIKLAKTLSAQIGNMIDYNELSNITGLHYKKLLEHLNILKQTYIIDLIQPYFTNKRTELTKNPKVYFVDTGFRNMLISDFRKLSERNDAGGLAENYVYSALKRRLSVFNGLNYWRTKSKAEIDFIFQDKGKLIPIEVKYSNNPSLGKSYYSFIDKYSPPVGYLLNRRLTGIRPVNNKKIFFIPLYYL